ncbi:hypothetical protein [Ruminococcus albus]|uniref:Uncharacterized protein n=1 Tax=Ruminococcus albus 8 TaxID=246199 RepID=E9SBH2_RUMAL|nr:hypothetical protein [Ruminococcus albus]EGC03375.1 hypothetical protein CUS_4530 [Ruminococcus albus 8]MCC3352043.1 hypothetical protein [Ruminococcus albus 8]
MKQSKIQKSFYFSDQKTKNIIEKRCADLALINNQSTSYIIEEKLKEGLFPKNKYAKELTTFCLYNDDLNYIKNTLDAAFQNNAAGIDWKSIHSNFYPIVMFSLKYFKGPDKFTGKEQEFHHLVEQLNLIIQRINNTVNGIINIEERSFLIEKAKSATELIATLKENPGKTTPYDIFEIIADFFAMLDDWSITYRALSDLAAICTFKESTTQRIELFDIVNELSVDWETKTEKNNDNETSINTDLYLNRVNLKVVQDDQFTNNFLSVYANDACVGNITAAFENILWNSMGSYNPKYQFKDEDIFASVVAELKKYKNEHGYKYLVIDDLRGGFASLLDQKMISRVGFKQLPDNYPSLYYLE